MPERKSYVSGTPNWVDLQTTDQAAAKQFYGELFGWKFNDVPMDETNDVVYSMATLKGLDVGAIAPLGEQAEAGIPPHWNSYVSVDDIEATAAKAKSLGAAVFAEPMDIEPGRFAVLADPQGAMFNVIKMSEA